jgi:hypothetical protein
MPRPLTLERAAQLEARARDIRAQASRRARAADTRAKVLLGALALAYAETAPNGPRLLEALARLPALKARDADFLAETLPEPLAAAFKRVLKS